MNFAKLINEARNRIDIPKGTTNRLHFTFILRRNTILSVGYNNMFKTDPGAKAAGYEYGFVHSEFDAIGNFPLTPKEFNKCRVVNIRLNKQGNILLAKPCKICGPMLVNLNFREVWYSDENGFIRFF